jgi:hypothetical protein
MAGSMAMTTPFAMRNKIINGAMEIDQRNAGASVTVVTGGGYYYATDRFNSFNNTGTNYTAQQVSDAPAKFTKSAKLTFSSAITLTTTNEATFQQAIEGLNLTDLGWGTASAQTITVSFWVKASYTGTFSVGICNDGGTRAYATTYTISVANTWEYKTVTIPGDISGTWLTTNGIGLFLRFNIIAGSNFQVAANNTWATRAGTYNAADTIYGTKAIGSATSVSAGATWQITGCQLEVGSVATPFERRLYPQEWSMCQRYYETNNALWSFFGNSTPLSVSLRTTKRASPTISVSTAGGATVSVSGGYTGTDAFRVTSTGASDFNWTASAEL